MATRGCPVITETVTYNLNSTVSQFAALVSHLRRQDFDYAMALSSHPMARALVACSGATRRICAGKAPFYLAPFFHQQVRGLLADPHEAARDHAIFSEIFNISAEVPPMWYASSRMESHGLLVEPQKYLVLHPGASLPSQVLEIDKWAQATRELLAAGLIAVPYTQLTLPTNRNGISLGVTLSINKKTNVISELSLHGVRAIHM